MLNRIWVAAIASIAAAVVAEAPAYASELRVIAPNAVKEAVAEVGSRYAKETGVKVSFTWTGSEAIAKRVSEGEVYDVVLITSTGVDRLATSGKLDGRTKLDFSRSAVAAAVRSGLPRPDISTIDGLKKALLAATTIAISSGASGRYLEDLFQRLGVSEQIKSKIKQPPSGAQIAEMLARGEADLGFQQVTELIHAKGIDYLGTLPPEVQNYTVWSGAVHTGAANSDTARAFLGALRSPAALPELRKTGLEPVS